MMTSSKRTYVMLFAAAFAFGLLAACGSPGSSAAPTPTPLQTDAAPPATDWEARWNEVVEGANQEGKLVLLTHTFLYHQHIVDKFREAYPGIEVEHIAIRPSEATSRIIVEQRGGIYAIDAWMSPTSNMHIVGIPAGIFTDITPFLIREDVTAPDNWRAGRMLFTSGDNFDEPFVAINSMNQGGELYVNRDIIPVSEFNDEQQLTDPKFKGQITIREATAPHAASFMLSGFLHAYGEDFVRTLMVDQEPLWNANARLVTDQVIQGRVGIAIGADNNAINTCMNEGACDHIEEIHIPHWVTAAGVAVFNNPPNPNAAAVFVSWFLGPEGQQVWVESTPATEDVGPYDSAHSYRADVEPHADAVRLQRIPDYSNLDQYSLTSAGDTSNLDWVIEYYNSIR